MATKSFSSCAPMKADCVFGNTKDDTRARGEIDLVKGRAETCAGRKVNRVIGIRNGYFAAEIEGRHAPRIQRFFVPHCVARFNCFAFLFREGIGA